MCQLDSMPKEILKNLNIWDKAAEKASFGTNVTEVLNWVAEASADAGIVYSTDAASNQKVKVIAEAPGRKCIKSDLSSRYN